MWNKMGYPISIELEFPIQGALNEQSWTSIISHGAYLIWRTAEDNIDIYFC